MIDEPESDEHSFISNGQDNRAGVKKNIELGNMQMRQEREVGHLQLIPYKHQWYHQPHA